MDNYTGIWDTELMTRTTSRGNCVSLVQIESESSKNAKTRPRLDIWASEKPFLDYLRGISNPACLGTRSVTSSAGSRARSSKPPNESGRQNVNPHNKRKKARSVGSKVSESV